MTCLILHPSPFIVHLSSCVFLFLVIAGGAASAVDGGEMPDARAERFVAHYDKVIRPLEIETSRCWWTANVSGKDEDYAAKEAAETRLDLALAEPKAFAELKSIREARPSDPILARAIEVLYLEYLARQIDPELLREINAKSNAVEKAFNVHRPRVHGKELTDNDVRGVLRKSVDSAERRAVWEASKEVGRIVEPDLKLLVGLRNQAARKLGFKDYHVMQLALGEQSQEQVLTLFDQLDALTRAPFRAAKAELDAALAGRYGIAVGDLRPWHYQDPFFQEAPVVSATDLDQVYKRLDILRLCREFYAGIGLPVDDVIPRSDLYERPGKNPRAFSTDIDREGDVRVLANIVPNREWLATMLHELGHSVYSSKNIPRSLPWVLRTDAHTLCTEGVAMMFEKFAGSAEWLAAMGVHVADPRQFNATTSKLRRNQLLVFSRWCQVMFRFEKELYGNPGQDLNRRWWELVEKYQEIRRPEGRDQPDYASKIHIIISPAYYHNYMLGQLFASQVHHAIARDVLHGADPATAVYVGNAAAGTFMKEKVFVPGRTLNWNELTRHATGEDLSPRAFAADFKSK